MSINEDQGWAVESSLDVKGVRALVVLLGAEKRIQLNYGKGHRRSLKGFEIPVGMELSQAQLLHVVFSLPELPQSWRLRVLPRGSGAGRDDDGRQGNCLDGQPELDGNAVTFPKWDRCLGGPVSQPFHHDKILTGINRPDVEEPFVVRDCPGNEFS